MDPRVQAFTNLVCIMNMPKPADAQGNSSNVSSSVLVDDLGQDLPPEAQQQDEEQTETSDLAKLIGEKICRKANLKQLFFSLSIDVPTTLEFQKSVKIMMATEKKVTGLLNSLQVE